MITKPLQLFLLTGSNWGLSLVFLSGILASLALMVGYRARLAGLYCWLFLTFLQLRNPLVLDGGDELLRLLLFWTPFLPLSARWSYEARLHPEWRRLPNSYRSVATVGLYAQYGLFYFFAALLKSGPDWWQTRLALYYTLSIDQFTTRFGHYLLKFPELLKWGTTTGLVCEYLLALLLLWPVGLRYSRALFYAVLCFFHLSLAAMLHLGIFEFIVILGSTAFLPGEWFREASTDGPLDSLPEGLPEAYRLTRLETGFAWFIVFYIAVVNVQSVKYVEKLPGWTYAVAEVTYEHQHWHLFAPAPFRDDGWFVFEVVDAEGRSHFEWGKGDTADKPDQVSAQFANQRWRRWLQTLAQNDFQGIQALRESTADYLYRMWAARHPDVKAARCRLLFFEERTPPPGQAPKVERRVLSERLVR